MYYFLIPLIPFEEEEKENEDRWEGKGREEKGGEGEEALVIKSF